MTSNHTRRIIAIFGPSRNVDSKVLARAEELGRAVAEGRQILLTGGTGPASSPVKNRAILGAGDSPWVGVDRKTSPGPECREVLPNGFVITSDLDHKRNYLEAYMCDAAIGLEGGKGTLSEITSALSLQRPVAFVGDGWKQQIDLDADCAQAVERLVEAALWRFRTSGGSDALDPVLTEEALRRGLANLPLYGYFDTRATARTVVDWIKSVLPERASLPGNFPAVKGHDTVKATYREWLADHGRA
jgi:predicted Rossmann-fold nucleotide-binding protein